MLRKHIYSGAWYPADRAGIEKYIVNTEKKVNATGCICPHAGWIYSGKIAGNVYSRLPGYDTYILLGPNHTGLGPKISIFPDGIWEMPLGNVEVDTETARNILSVSEFAQSDYTAHNREHSLEVQLPFIQYFNPDCKIVPVLIKTDEYEICADLANSIYSAVKKSSKKILIVISTDMTHYESIDYAKKQDQFAIDEILSLNAGKLIETVQKKGITMCGVAPAVTGLLVSKRLGAVKSELIDYGHSGNITGDTAAVVTYAGFIIK